MKILSKNLDVAQSVRHTFEHSTIHAIPKILKHRFNTVRLVWLVSFLISTSWCIWFALKSLSNYFEYEAISKIEIKYENELIFPIVGICNNNQFTTEYSREQLRKVPLLNETYPKFGFIYLASLSANQLGDKKIIDKKKLGASLNETVAECLFNIKQCNMEDDFEHYYDVTHGNCFRFNSGRNMNGKQVPFKYVYQKGLLNSLQLTLYVGAAAENRNLFAVDNGMRIFINNESLDSTAREGIRVAPGTSTDIIISKYTIKQIPIPYSNCVGDLDSIDSYNSECYKRTFSPNRTYHYTDCLKVCFQRLLGKECKCQSTFYDFVYYQDMVKCNMPFASGDRRSYTMTNKNGSGCEQDNFLNFMKSPQLINQCDCPLECENSGYTHTNSFSEFPAQNYVYYLSEMPLIKQKFPNSSDLTQQNLKHRILKVNIFYDQMTQTKVSFRVMMPLSDLVSSIGGTFGLFLGLSFLSLIEFVEAFIQAVIILLNKKDNVLFKRSTKVSSILSSVSK